MSHFQTLANQWFAQGNGSVYDLWGQAREEEISIDHGLLGVAMVLTCFGLVMVASASLDSADRLTGTPFFYVIRQGEFCCLALAAAALFIRFPMRWWQQSASHLLVLAGILLLLVIIPGIGSEINGSSRWLGVGGLNLQVSELVKLAVMIYVADYLTRKGTELRDTLMGVLRPWAILGVVGFLLLLEPDFGAAAVILITAQGMLFLGGARLIHFIFLVLVAALGLSLLIISSPYRLERLIGFIDPWADPFNSGFQLTQALIAIGRGEWFGVGLGNGIQKLFYLPEAHTDFLFAVLTEELGIAGALLVIVTYGYIVFRAFRIASLAEHYKQYFNAYLAYGIGIWLGFQAFINIGVNLGILPTKGLTLPFLSYGGSSLLMVWLSLALLLRIYHEAVQPLQSIKKARNHFKASQTDTLT